MCSSAGVRNIYLQHVHKQIRNDINSQAILLQVQLRCALDQGTSLPDEYQTASVVVYIGRLLQSLQDHIIS